MHIRRPKCQKNIAFLENYTFLKLISRFTQSYWISIVINIIIIIIIIIIINILL